MWLLVTRVRQLVFDSLKAHHTVITGNPITTFTHAYTLERCTDCETWSHLNATLQLYVCLYEASIPIFVSPIADFRMEVRSFVWCVIHCNVYMAVGTLDL